MKQLNFLNKNKIKFDDLQSEEKMWKSEQNSLVLVRYLVSKWFVSYAMTSFINKLTTQITTRYYLLFTNMFVIIQRLVCGSHLLEQQPSKYSSNFMDSIFSNKSWIVLWYHCVERKIGNVFHERFEQQRLIYNLHNWVLVCISMNSCYVYISLKRLRSLTSFRKRLKNWFYMEIDKQKNHWISMMLVTWISTNASH